MTPAPPSAIVDTLRGAGCVFAEDEARLLADAARTPAELEAMVQRRVDGLPLEQVVGWAEFCGLRIAVAPGVFVPRRRTEVLVERAVALAPPRAVLVDLCCGSGAVAAAVARTADVAELHAVDIAAAAVDYARLNLPESATVHHGDLYDALPPALRGRVDLLVANAPYVPTEAVGLMPPEARLHEPRAALDGGADGLDVLRRVVAGAPSWLAPRGHLLCESGRQQAPALAEACALVGLVARVVVDDERAATVVVGAWPPTA